jgi:hypothetical protein
MATALPMHPWIERLTLTISGHDRLYRRSDLHAHHTDLRP